jgi:arginine utilization protein RocB
MNNKQKNIKIVNDLQLDMHGQLYLGSIGKLLNAIYVNTHV